MQAQKGGALVFFMKFMGLAGVEQQHLPRCKRLPDRAGGDQQRTLHDPDQLPFRVNMGRAVVHRVKKQAESLDLWVLDNLILVHAFSPWNFLYP